MRGKAQVAPWPIRPGEPLHPQLPGSTFQHGVCVGLPRHPGSVLEVYRDLAALVPAWFDVLMRVRNAGMRLLGMKDLGALRAVDAIAQATPGQRLGIFTVQAVSDDTLVLEDSDRHLRVQLSLQVRQEAQGWTLHNATVVHLHNRLGWWYMLPVAPVHRWIMPLLLRRYVRRLAMHGNASGDAML